MSRLVFEQELALLYESTNFAADLTQADQLRGEEFEHLQERFSESLTNSFYTQDFSDLIVTGVAMLNYHEEIEGQDDLESQLELAFVETSFAFASLRVNQLLR